MQEDLASEEEKLKQFMCEQGAVVSSVYFAHQGNPGSGWVDSLGQFCSGLLFCCLYG